MPFISLPFPQLTLQALLRHKLGCLDLQEFSSVFFPGNYIGSFLPLDPQQLVLESLVLLFQVAFLFCELRTPGLGFVLCCCFVSELKF